MGKMTLNIYMKGDYEDFHALGRRKNKANSKPISIARIRSKAAGRCRLSWQGAVIPSEESIEARIELFLDLFAPVLDIGLAHPHVGLYSHGLERLVFVDVKRTLVRVPESSNTDGCFCVLDVSDGTEEPVAYFADPISHSRWPEQGQDEIETVAEAVYRQGLTQIFMNWFQAVLILSGIAEAQNSARCVDSEPVQLRAGTIAFPLEHAIDKTYGRHEIVEEIANSQPGRRGDNTNVNIGNRLDNPEVKRVINIVHRAIKGLQRVG